ncbi:MAG: cobalt-precorrin 5A hydrolase [Clostridiales bacterium]|nr:cobalt-precorrin 5A hydrolase [Clostridiales bacterium]
MIVACRAFTRSGMDVKHRIETGLSGKHQIEQKKIEPLSRWTQYYMEERMDMDRQNALVFIGAVGIAVRCIAPYIRDKYTDPAVVVVDDMGKHVIPVLSGHMGGANELAREIAQIIGGEPVITTATDLHAVFAVDEFAKKNNLWITSRERAKQISSALLSGKTVGLSAGCQSVQGTVPEGIHVPPQKMDSYQIYISASLPEKGNVADDSLHLVPKSLVVGMGCRIGVSEEKLEAFLKETLHKNRLCLRAVRAIASLDRKKEEPGLILLAQKLGIPFLTYTKQQLERTLGEFHGSAYVEMVTGVDNVCERSAVLASEGGTLLVSKTIGDKITLAVAEKEWSVRF